MQRRSTAVLFLLCCCVSPVLAQPAQVIIIRHAEKPEKGHSLSAKGWQRAAALVGYFQERPDVLEFKTPVAIYAQKSTKGHRSLRPVETVTPLAKALGLKVIEFGHDDYEAMVKEIDKNPAYGGKMVLISWEHHGIPPLAAAFGVTSPPKWPGSAFDRTWVITFAGKKAYLRNRPQKLLPGDSE